MLKRLHHVGVTGEDFERAIERFKGFGLACEELIDNKEAGIKIGFLRTGGFMLELISHTRPDSGEDPVTSLIRSRKGTINHICFEVDDLEDAIQDFERNGAKLVKGCPRTGAYGRTAFFYPDTTEDVLIQLYEVL
ncbi:MAG: VOC family protein [Syntrophorhabdaceae bacterium]|nr:VOC family protein [Syntrophorhabdaceae bacterium]